MSGIGYAGQTVATRERSGSLRTPPVGVPRLLTTGFRGQPTSLSEHLARHAPLPRRLASSEADAMIAAIGRAGLTGRGGAGFPTARKLRAVAAAGGRPIVIANGTEGEPASSKDKVLAATEPHLVLDGTAIAASVVGARHALVVVDEAIREIVAAAVAERQAAQLDRVRLYVLPAAEGFVSGEASAVVRWIERGVPWPTSTPPRLAERGLHGQPTLVQNVETLAHLGLIARYGAEWFRAVGTPAEPGSMLVTAIGAVRDPGVNEVEIGWPLSEVLALAGGPAEQIGALLLGGYSGTWARWPDVASLPYSAAGLADQDASPGAGLVAALPADRCPLAETARIVSYLAAESAGQCGPCVFGLAAVSADMTYLADGYPVDLFRLNRWLGQVEGRGACRHPDGAVRLIRSALATFGSEVREHLAGWCTGTSNSPTFPIPIRRRR